MDRAWEKQKKYIQHFGGKTSRKALFSNTEEAELHWNHKCNFDYVLHASRPAPGPTQPPTQQVPGALFSEVKWPGREDNHSPPSSAEVKECVELLPPFHHTS
jgi:hypothetical protein